MIRSLELGILLRRTAALSLRSGIHINTVLFARRRVPHHIPYKPGLSNYDKILETGESDPGFPGLIDEYDKDADFDFSNTEEAYDTHIWEMKQNKKRIQKKIIAKKFFAPRPQPLMLTWNERQCMKFLHNKDPVQWNIKSLSESFPATPDVVKKIIKSKRKVSPERAKILDSIAQKNWELLAEGKLDADQHVLEHLKKFVNRREVLLEQINNADFYLPEIKKEPVWNQGEMNKILLNYEKALSKLAAEAHQSENLKALSDGVSEEKNTKKENKSNFDLIHEKIKEESKKVQNLNDTFLFGGMINTFKENITLEALENEVLRKAEARRKLDLVEKVVLDSKLGVSSSENVTDINENRNHKEYNSSTSKSAKKENSSFTPSLKKNLIAESRVYMETDENYASNRFKKMVSKDKSVLFDERSQFTDETGVGKLLKVNVPEEQTKITEEKPKIDFSDPVRLEKEKVYYDKEVSDIKDTAFWNNNRKSSEKATAEHNKELANIPGFSNNEDYISRATVLSKDTYPERIKIPKDKRGSGFTFRIKDCYYDDDGEFLYRVPGMIK